MFAKAPNSGPGGGNSRAGGSKSATLRSGSSVAVDADHYVASPLVGHEQQSPRGNGITSPLQSVGPDYNTPDQIETLRSGKTTAYGVAVALSTSNHAAAPATGVDEDHYVAAPPPPPAVTSNDKSATLRSTSSRIDLDAEQYVALTPNGRSATLRRISLGGNQFVVADTPTDGAKGADVKESARQSRRGSVDTVYAVPMEGCSDQLLVRTPSLSASSGQGKTATLRRDGTGMAAENGYAVLDLAAAESTYAVLELGPGDGGGYSTLNRPHGKSDI